jgi:sugar/nucleoside kinase (ribokinase family)
MADVLCLGEILVDWVCTEPGKELAEAKVFTKAPGGAPANVAVGLSRQGVSTGFIGRVSSDEFGQWLKQLLESEGIDTTCCIMDPESATRMAYIVTTTGGDRKLADFSRIACADARLNERDLNLDMIRAASVLHFGSISLIDEPAATATRKAVEAARHCGAVISYDPNVRLGLWPSAIACRDAILRTLGWADIVKINLEELEFLTGSTQLESAATLRAQHNIALLVVTLDRNGCHVFTEQQSLALPGFQISLVEATGAGDGFTAALISGLLPCIINSPNRRTALNLLGSKDLTEILIRANAVGAITCTRPGAIPALPTKNEIEEFLRNNYVIPRV